MAKKTTTSSSTQHKAKPRRKRPGVHAKTKASSLKSSKLWKKTNRGQGSKR
jgi:hypothetical protein